MHPVPRTTDGTLVRNPIDDFERLARDLLSWADAWRPAAFEGIQVALGDLEETDDAFIVEIDLPGIDKKDVDIDLEGRRLTVTGERKERERTGMLRRRTRTVGTYRHELVLPADVDEDGVDASLHDGVLTVRLPKHTATHRRRIAIR